MSYTDDAVSMTTEAMDKYRADDQGEVGAAFGCGRFERRPGSESEADA
jgi:hypothetical protein